MKSGLQSGLGRGDQRSGNALAEAAAEAEGGRGADLGLGAGDGGRGGRDENIDGFRCAINGPGAYQTSGRETFAGQAFAVESCAAGDGGS